MADQPLYQPSMVERRSPDGAWPIDSVSTLVESAVDWVRTHPREVGMMATGAVVTATLLAGAASRRGRRWHREPDGGLSKVLSTAAAAAAIVFAVKQSDDLGAGVQRTAQSVTQGGRNLAGQLGQQATAVSSGLQRASRRAATSVESARSSAMASLQDEPLRVGAVLAGVGILAGLITPPTNAERRLFGAPRESLRRQLLASAERLRAQLIEAGSAVIEHVIDSLPTPDADDDRADGASSPDPHRSL